MKTFLKWTRMKRFGCDKMMEGPKTFAKENNDDDVFGVYVCVCVCWSEKRRERERERERERVDRADKKKEIYRQTDGLTYGKKKYKRERRKKTPC